MVADEAAAHAFACPAVVCKVLIAASRERRQAGQWGVGVSAQQRANPSDETAAAIVDSDRKEKFTVCDNTIVVVEFSIASFIIILFFDADSNANVCDNSISVIISNNTTNSNNVNINNINIFNIFNNNLFNNYYNYNSNSINTSNNFTNTNNSNICDNRKNNFIKNNSNNNSNNKYDKNNSPTNILNSNTSFNDIICTSNDEICIGIGMSV